MSDCATDWLFIEWFESNQQSYLSVSKEQRQTQGNERQAKRGNHTATIQCYILFFLQNKKQKCRIEWPHHHHSATNSLFILIFSLNVHDDHFIFKNKKVTILSNDNGGNNDDNNIQQGIACYLKRSQVRQLEQNKSCYVTGSNYLQHKVFIFLAMKWRGGEGEVGQQLKKKIQIHDNNQISTKRCVNNTHQQPPLISQVMVCNNEAYFYFPLSVSFF